MRGPDDAADSASPAGEDLLPPELLDQVGDLEWVARRVARLLAAGAHETRSAGRGEEFERHQPYQQGDDLRYLDWKLLARTDRLYLRRFRERSHLRTLFVLDASASMAFEGGAPVTKLRYGVLLAAILGHLARDAGDAVGLVVAGAEAEAELPPGRGSERWRAVLHALQGVRGAGGGDLGPWLERAGLLATPGSRIVILSDFLEGDDGIELMRSVGHLRARGDEVGAIRILSPEELGRSGGDEALYTDPEDPERLLPAAPGRDPGYLARLDAYYAELSRGLVDRGARWAEVSSADPLLPFLRGWFRAPDRSLRGARA